MTITAIPFELNHKPGVLNVCYEANQSAVKSGFDLFAEMGFDVNLCLGYPTMRAFVSSYEGTGYNVPRLNDIFSIITIAGSLVVCLKDFAACAGATGSALFSWARSSARGWALPHSSHPILSLGLRTATRSKPWCGGFLRSWLLSAD